LVNIFGHIHEGYGVQYGDKTLFVNSSICTAGYEPTNKPIVIDLVEINNKIQAIYVEE
jgi:Icc-related predicted phosphoesterase